jgi:hypothetical protein
MSFKNGKKLFEVCQNLEGISVASYFHVYENEDAVSHCKLWFDLFPWRRGLVVMSPSATKDIGVMSHEIESR